jgi:hypothetical protein
MSTVFLLAATVACPKFSIDTTTPSSSLVTSAHAAWPPPFMANENWYNHAIGTKVKTSSVFAGLMKMHDLELESLAEPTNRPQ